MTAKVDRMHLDGEASLGRVRLESPPAFREVFDRHGRYVWRTLRRLGVREADAKDMCQEVFMVVHRRLPEFDGSSSIRTWVYGITVRVASQYRRRAVHRREELSEQVVETPSAPPQHDDLEERWLRRRLEAALNGLDEHKRTVFVLYELEELTLSEISTVLGCPLQTVYFRLRTAREAVRRAFTHVADERDGR